ncbi:MAG: hypothetical protein AMJ46_04880 [Latescibacteria bacterium DG_63]|nr:MAG: hypothetical protein AMJ46_04880 [Latescibacteria bacterium DG_63]
MSDDTAGMSPEAGATRKLLNGTGRPVSRGLSVTTCLIVLLAFLSVQVSAEDFTSWRPGTARADTSMVSCRTLDASSRVVTYRFSSLVDTLRLPDRNIFVGSERVCIGETVVPRGAYFLNCEKGIICLSDPVPEGSEVTVAYRFLPFHFRESYYLRLPDTVQGPRGNEKEAPPRVTGKSSYRKSAAGLRLRGTKTFSLELGSNREASLKQSLDMNVTGEISKGLQLTAMLTDRDLPVQPDGRTESLSELDEIRVELRSESFRAALGDCDLLLDGPSLVNVSRKLEGAKASGTIRGTDVVLAGSMLRGRWTTREFMGTDGKQGPYQLTTDAGAPCVVVAGTEKVWLDGVKLRRGESADYWMDYGSGKLHFTNRRPITGHSRIAVEYEYAAADYQKNLYATAIGTPLAGDAGRLELLFVSEADEKNARLGTLSQEEEIILRELGDSPANGTSDGAIYVGPGRGDYDVVREDSTGASYYRFATQGEGEYIVSFVRVGEGRGSYFASTDTTGLVHYVYAGAGQADYVPERKLVAPASRQVGDIRTTVSAGGFDVAAEFALSHNDLNTFSSKDDGDNLGKAGLISLSSGARRLSVADRSLGQLRFGGKFRTIGENFRTFGNLNRAFDYENWAVTDTSFRAHGEKRLELETDYSPLDNVTVSLQHGRLSSSSGLSATRSAYSSELSGRFSLSARLERAASEANDGSGRLTSTRTLKSLGSRLTGWSVVPAARYHSEVRENGDGTGLMAEEFGGGVSSAWSFPVAVRVEETYRVEYLGTSRDRTRSYDAFTRSLSLEVTRWRGLSASCEYSVRDLNGYSGLGSRRTELGRLFLSQRSGSGKVSYEANHVVTTLHSQSRTRNIVYVGADQGHYDSTGTFRGRGDYEIEITELDSSVLSADATTSATLALRPFKGIEKEGSLLAVLESLSSSSFFRSSGVMKGGGRLFSSLRNPMYTEVSEAIRANSLLREELEITSPTRTLALRYRCELSSVLNNQYQNAREKSSELRHGLRLRSEPVDAVTLELEQTWRAKERTMEFDAGSAVAGRLTSAETMLELKYFVTSALELGLYGSVAGMRDADGGNSLAVSKFSPSATYAAGRSTRARLMLTLSSYTGDLGVLAVASSGAFVMPGRMEILFSLDHRAGQHLTISTRVNSRKSGDTFVTDGRVEMRAHF